MLTKSTPAISKICGREFTVTALYPHDTRVILSLPPRGSPKLDALRDFLNHIRLFPDPHTRDEAHVLMFSIDELRDVFVDSPNATWATLVAQVPADQLDSYLDLSALRSAIEHLRTRVVLRLFGGGIAVLVVEVSLRLADMAPGEDRLAESLVDAVHAVGYSNTPLTLFCRRLLETVSAQLRSSVIMSEAAVAPQIRLDCRPYIARIRTASVAEIWPTMIAKVSSAPSIRFKDFDLSGTDLAGAIYLDVSEMTNVLPAFEDDYIAVGYDSVWWLASSVRQERTDRFPERVELTFQYALAISMLIYVLHGEIDRELQAIRSSTDGSGRQDWSTSMKVVDDLRSEIEDLLKEISLESFSTWVSDIFLFRAILANWLIDSSTHALRRKVDITNVIVRETHQQVSEREQEALTRVGTIFAAASVASLFIAAVTLLFTQTAWENQNSTVGGVLLVLKLVIISYVLALPALLLKLMPRWESRARGVVEKLTGSRRDER